MQRQKGARTGAPLLGKTLPKPALTRGSALLTVLWISAALAAVGFALANTVRGETERASTMLDDLKAYYLATGGVDKAALDVMWSAASPGNRRLPIGTTQVDYPLPTGIAHVEIIPETAKLSVRTATATQLSRLMQWLQVEPERAQAIVQGVLAIREGRGGSFSSIQGPSFPGQSTSFQEIEELLSVKGVTPEIFYGTYVPVQEPLPGQPRLVRRSGLIDCLSAIGSGGPVDANTADPAVLFAVGVPLEGIRALVALRSRGPMDAGKMRDLTPLLGEGAPQLRQEGKTIITFRSTGRVRLPNGQLSDLKRTVSATIKYMPKEYDSPIHVLRWYDTAWSN